MIIIIAKSLRLGLAAISLISLLSKSTFCEVALGESSLLVLSASGLSGMIRLGGFGLFIDELNSLPKGELLRKIKDKNRRI